MMEVTFSGYKPNEITPLMCSEITDNIELGDLNDFKTLEDIKMFNNLESISIGNIDSEPEENVISDKKLDEFIKQLNEAFVILPNLHMLVQRFLNNYTIYNGFYFHKIYKYR